MKKSELRKLIEEYKNLKSQSGKKQFSSNHAISDKLKELARSYFHETGSDIDSDLNL